MSKKQLVEFKLNDDQTILVEVSEIEDSGIEPVSRKKVDLAAKAEKTFNEAISNLEPMISSIKDKIDAMNQPADEVEVKFGIKLNGETSAIVATIDGDNFKVYGFPEKVAIKITKS